MVNDTVFVQLRFWLLVGVSVLAPLLIYIGLVRRRTIVRPTILGLGACLVLIAGADVYLLQTLASMARASLSLSDDPLFASELSVALYVLPIAFGGIGVNVISHVLIDHLLGIERCAAAGRRPRLARRRRRVFPPPAAQQRRHPAAARTAPPEGGGAAPPNDGAPPSPTGPGALYRKR